MCWFLTQRTFTFSKSTIEILEELWNMFKVNKKNTRTTKVAIMTGFCMTATLLVLVFLLLTLKIFPFSSVSIVDFGKVNVSLEVKRQNSYSNYVTWCFATFNLLRKQIINIDVSATQFLYLNELSYWELR